VFKFVNKDENIKRGVMDCENKLGNRIKSLRKSMGLTQEQLAEKVGIDNKYLSKVENGQHLPTYRTLLKLSTVLNCSLGGIDEKFSTIDDSKSLEYIKALKILDSASNSREESYYLEVLKLAQKGLKLGKI